MNVLKFIGGMFLFAAIWATACTVGETIRIVERIGVYARDE